MLEMAILSGIGFYLFASSYMDSLYKERKWASIRASLRYPRYFPDMAWYYQPPRKREKPEKVDWQNEGF